MRISRYIIGAFFLLISCTGNTIYEKPKNLIPKDTMIALLTDMHIASTSRLIKNKQKQKDVNYMFVLYEKYKIDSTRFHNSNVYYASKIDEYGDLLKEIKRNLEAKGAVVQKIINDRDSIKKENMKPIPISEEIDSLKKMEFEIEENE